MPSINIMVLKYNINTTMEKKLKQFLTCNNDYTDLRSELIVSQILIFLLCYSSFLLYHLKKNMLWYMSIAKEAWSWYWKWQIIVLFQVFHSCQSLGCMLFWFTSFLFWNKNRWYNYYSQHIEGVIQLKQCCVGFILT